MPHHGSLKAMAEAKVDGVQKATYFKVAPYKVQIEEGWNGRDDTPDLHEYRQRLKQAMKNGAMIPPVDVEVVDGELIVRDGHSRTLMARELVDEGHPYVLEARHFRGNEADARYHMIGTQAGRPLTPLELGRQFKLLISYGQTTAQIAERTGLHRSTVENGLQLADAPVAVQKMISAGEVASHTALKTVRQLGGKAATAALAEGVKTAKAAGKKKVTAKHLPDTAKPVPKAIVGEAQAALSEPRRPGVTTEAGKHAATGLVQLARDLAAFNVTAAVLDRAALGLLVTRAKELAQ